MRVLSLLSLCYVIHLTNCLNLSNLLGYYLGIRRLCLCRCGTQQTQNNGVNNYRMLGGEPTQPLQMPWLVYIHANKIFTGTLISNRHIITAATNVNNLLPSNVSVSLGLNGLCEKFSSAFKASVEAIIINPKYTQSRRNNDIALIKLRNEVLFSEFVTPICMPIYDSDEHHLAEVATVASDDEKVTTYCNARTSSLPILSERSCLSNTNSSLLTPDKGCLGPVGTIGTLCESDIGSPVMTRFSTMTPYRLVGIISSASCYEKQTALYTRIIDHLPWIHENIRRDCQCF